MKVLHSALGACLALLFANANAQEVQRAEAEPPAPQAAAESAKEEKPDAPNPANSQRRRATSSADRLDLDTTVVTGNRELPKVLYIVPWKKAEIGDLPAQPFNTLLDEVLSPVDRDVFKREVKYFHTVTQSDGAATATPGKPSEGTGRAP